MATFAKLWYRYFGEQQLVSIPGAYLSLHMESAFVTHERHEVCVCFSPCCVLYEKHDRPEADLFVYSNTITSPKGVPSSKTVVLGEFSKAIPDTNAEKETRRPLIFFMLTPCCSLWSHVCLFFSSASAWKAASGPLEVPDFYVARKQVRLI